MASSPVEAAINLAVFTDKGERPRGNNCGENSFDLQVKAKSIETCQFAELGSRAMPSSTRAANSKKVRCDWCTGSDIYVAYHDKEWGVPVYDDNRLFEFLVLEGAQAGLSWSTILNKRENYRTAFADFEPERVAKFRPERLERLMLNPGIVRNRKKIESTIGNARAFLKIQQEFGSFSNYQWRFVDGRPIVNRWGRLSEIPPKTPISDKFAKDLYQRGFRFVGSTIIYAHMQAVGMVNDHLVSCFRHVQLAKRR